MLGVTRQLLARLGIGVFAALLLASAPAVARAAQPGANGTGVGTELVLRALSLLGVHYKLGGNSPETGLDCSGLVRLVFMESAGLVLPRRAEEMSRNGDAISRDQLRPGDLVFFNTLRRAFSHVGIYIGNGQFVHAPSSGGSVRVEDLSGAYWRKRFNGARRLLAANEVVQREDATHRASRSFDLGSAPARDDGYGFAVPHPPAFAGEQAPSASRYWISFETPYVN